MRDSIQREHWIQKRIRHFRHRQHRNRKAIRVLAEGDSWFSYPAEGFTGSTVIQEMNREDDDDKSRPVNIVSIANPGSELKDIVGSNNKQWAYAVYEDWLYPETYDLVLFSGGGNDIIGAEMAQFILEKTGSVSGADLVNWTAFNDQLDKMTNYFNTLRAYVGHLLPGVPILVHGYDFAVPNGAKTQLLGGLFSIGGWLKVELAGKNITDFAEQQAIVNALVIRFNALLKTMAETQDGFYYVNLMNTLKAPDDWADEIHPSGQGIDKLKRKFMIAIHSVKNRPDRKVIRSPNLRK